MENSIDRRYRRLMEKVQQERARSSPGNPCPVVEAAPELEVPAGIGVGSIVEWTATGREKLKSRRWDHAGIVEQVWDWPDSARTVRIRWDSRRDENAWEYDVIAVAN